MQASDGPFQKHYSIKFSLSWSDGVPKIRQQYEQRTAMELSKLKRGGKLFCMHVHIKCVCDCVDTEILEELFLNC